MDKKSLVICLLVLLGIGRTWGQSVWNVEHLQQVKQCIDQPFYAAAYAELKAQADALLDVEPLSVVMKEKAPVSGDKHDYMSLARYYWPDPSKPDGLPYISRDGVSNPELEKYDRNRLGDTANRVATLSLAWYFSGDEKYAEKAVELIRVWFLNKETCMNPHMDYAQVTRGRKGDMGNPSGVLDGYSFITMLDGIQLLEGSKAFTKKDSKRLKQWFSKYLQWVLTSKQGVSAGQMANNHSVAYDAQVIAYALYCGNHKVALEVLNALPEKRLYPQIEPDGKQPLELKRTLAFHYSQYNLTHFIDIYQMGKKLGVKVDQATSADGRNFYKAMDFLANYLGKPQSEWPYRQISNWEGSQQNFCRDLYRAYLLNPEKKEYLRLYKEHRIMNWKNRFNLLYVVPSEVDNAYAFACRQMDFAIDCVTKARKDEKNAAKRKVQPRTIAKDGSLAMIHSRDWCSGFFPGSLWSVYEYTNDSYWRQQAISSTWPIEDAKWYGGTHDLGFMMYCSFGRAYENTGERSYKDVVVQAARTLITRFNPTVGCIRSWDFAKDKWDYPVIIDNMMNLEMLYRATQLTGDSTFWKVAHTHAHTTMKNHFRPDFSSYHVIDYSQKTGEVRKRNTHQGNADDSFWSRGQAWGLYGYTMCYRFEKDAAYLRQAEGIADFILGLKNMPGDGIPYWDMKLDEIKDCTADQVNADVPRDASAASLIASALYELCTYVSPEKGAKYRAFADKIIHSLNHHYQAPVGTHYGFLLLHSTGHFPARSEVDVPLNYADYYYLEALLRKERLDLR